MEQKSNLPPGKIIDDIYFFNQVTEEINKMINDRQLRPEPKKGYRYCRSFFDRMVDNNQLDPKFFVDNIESIWLKKSKLNSESRNVIDYVCKRALTNTINYYQSLINAKDEKEISEQNEQTTAQGPDKGSEA